MLESIIIDDDIMSIRNLLCLIDSLDYVRCVGSSRNIEDGLDLINTIKPEIVFLHSKFVGALNFDLLQKIQNKNFYIICVASLPGNALEAIKNIAIDYLLKPVQFKALKTAIGKCIRNKDESKIKNAISGTINQKERKISLHTCKGIEFFSIDSIVRLQTCGNYSTIFFENGRKIISSKALKYFEKKLSQFSFIRINRQDLVHTRFIKKMHKGRYPILVLKDDERLKVSDRKRKVVRKVLAESPIGII